MSSEVCISTSIILDFQVTNYDVIVDGIDELVDQLEFSESLSCRMIFNCTKVGRRFSTSISVYCLWKNVRCRKSPLYPCINSKNEAKMLESGSYHLLRVTHKFPLQEKVCSNCIFGQKIAIGNYFTCFFTWAVAK